MKTKYPSMFGLLAVFMLVASLVVPANLASPAAVEADPGICKWDTLSTPAAQLGRNDVVLNTEINRMDAGNDGKTLIAAVNFLPNGVTTFWWTHLYSTDTTGIFWSTTPGNHLVGQIAGDNPAIAAIGQMNVWDVDIAPDDPNFWAVVTSADVAGAAVNAPIEVYVTENAGAGWECTTLVDAIALPLVAGIGVTEVACIDISMDYGGRRDIAVGVRNGTGTTDFQIYVVQSAGYSGWNLQTATPLRVLNNTAAGAYGRGTGDVLDLEFSPTYVGDAALAVVYSIVDVIDAPRGTFYDVALRDLDQNNISTWAFNSNGMGSVEVHDVVAAGFSPRANEIRDADLELPSDFSGQAASLRRAYVSTDDSSALPAVSNGDEVGVFRVDDNVVYELRDTQAQPTQAVASIAYYGTYASGKLLYGEIYGDACAATVPTWFTDSPTTCPIPCWYPALKPTTGAAGLGCGVAPCQVGGVGIGQAQVEWNADGSLAYVGTGWNAVLPGANWWLPLLGPPVPNDESAFAISRNNGETWNQLAIIDTTIDWFNDVAPSPDCTTIYLASASTDNVCNPGCNNFDSVWRTSVNADVLAPLPNYGMIGFYWERVYCRVTAVDCERLQSDLPILRLAPDKTDGEIVGWAAQDSAATRAAVGGPAMAWSPDFGDYWANIFPRGDIQDFCFESSTVLYNLTFGGTVQKMPYTGTAWSSAETSKETYGAATHMIAAQAEGKVLVGFNTGFNAVAFPGSLAKDYDASPDPFQTLWDKLPTQGSVHVAFDPDFDNNLTFFVADDAANGTVYRNSGATVPVVQRWEDNDMMAAANGAIGSGPGGAAPLIPAPPHPVGQFGLQLAWTGHGGQTALYSAHRPVAAVGAFPGNRNSGVCRTLYPLDGMPKPGIIWDCLDVFVNVPVAPNTGVLFTLEPWSLKKCGCLTLDTDTILYAIDDEAFGTFNAAPAAGYTPGVNQGMLWGFTDCLAKVGPTLITEDGMLVGCDPVSGRNQEINLCWEQLCVATEYDIELAKDEDFTILVVDWVPAWYNRLSAGNVIQFLVVADMTNPCVYFPAGGSTTLTVLASEIAFFGNLECGHTYYWRVQARYCATGQVVRSPWSEVRSFTIKAGLPVRADYYGIKLLSPDNGCLGCPVSPASFSWAPFKGTEKYKFVLAKDAALTDVIAEAEVGTTAYEYDGTLDYSTNYFWRVMSLEPAPSDWSATFSFQTEAAPEAPPAAPEAPTTPLWVWVVIAIGAILVIVTLVLIFKTRRV